MGFYNDKNTVSEKQIYKKYVAMMGSLSNLFSENNSPYIDSRIAENLFCRCLNAKNLSRSDVTADAQKGKIGIGIKTWIQTDHQKIAEFNKQREDYIHLSDEYLILKVADLRNTRISFTKDTYGLDEMIYHCVKRETGKITFNECPLVSIDIPNIKNIEKKNNSIFFEDGINKYSFNLSKSTLYKYFDDLTEVDSFSVDIIKDPFALLASKLCSPTSSLIVPEQSILGSETDGWTIQTKYLKLYSYKKGKKYVPEKSGLNIRLASGRRRDENEVYIPISVEDHKKDPDFFPSRDKPFNLSMPDGSILSVKVCQDGSKALMSNPNKALGKWILRKILKVKGDEPVTYELLEKYAIDSVRIDKMINNITGETTYSIDFAVIGSYEQYIGNTNIVDYFEDIIE